MKRIHLICNAHLDPVWQWTWDEGIAAAISTFRSAADLCDEFDYIFCHNEALLYEAMEKYAPELFERIGKLIKEGKWKIIGGWYLQPDCNMPSGESLVRQIKAGQRYFYDKFGVTPSIACNFDSFGHSLGLVQILKKCGYTGYIHTRPGTHAFSYPGRFFDWVAPDGSRITVCRAAGYGTGMGKAKEAILGRIKDAEDVDVVLWGVGNHGGGPSRKDLRDIALIDEADAEVLHSSPEALFADDIRISGEIRSSLVTSMPGCYTSMMRIKQAHRQTENIIYSAEKIMSIASLAGCTFDENELREAEKKLLLAEFHDILPGSSIPEGEQEGLELLYAARRPFRDGSTKALNYLVMGEKKAKEGEYPIFVFNPLPYEVTRPVEAEFTLADQNWDESTITVPSVYTEDGVLIKSQQIKEKPTLNLDWRKRIIFEGTLKPMGITRFNIRTSVIPNEKEKKKNIPFDELFKSQNILTAPVSLLMYEDDADPWGMSNDNEKLGKNPVRFVPMTAEECGEFCRTAELEAEHIIETGDIYTGCEQFVKCNNTNAVIEYRFYGNQPYIDIKVTLESSEKNRLICLNVPTPDGTLCGDGPFITEAKPENDVCFRNWLGKEKGGEITAVINNCLYGGRGAENGIELSLLRTPGYLFHPIGDRELYPGDRYLPRIDCGRYVYTFRIMKGNVNEITLEGAAFNEEINAVNMFPIETGNKKAQIYTDRPVCMPVCHTAEGRTVMRFYNPDKDTGNFHLTVNGASASVEVPPAAVVSAVYENGKIEIHSDDMPL